MKLGERNNIKYYLFDLRGAPNIESVIYNYEFAYREMADISFPKDTKSVILTDPGDRSHDFMETVFLNAGYNVRLFTDLDTAHSWLTG
ncbi:hypothetical protein [Candidatus Thiodiazotropha sp. CDECU1]|uniref:hypothetical protein n=1 Tax=Candidatus Thiodiazotropha sp. CDECU1 TaxID=3065865 RepID=UPI00292FE556|nr:hypothetical protein [Candidatus Thiodiazotropha sp. CDECU1]